MEEEGKTQRKQACEQRNINIKIPFWKKIWYSITKIEKYPEMSAQGFGKAVGYLALIVAILTVVICIGVVYQLNSELKRGIDYLQNDFPDFSYSNGELKVDSKDKIDRKSVV